MSNILATNKTNNRTFHIPPFNIFYLSRLEPRSVWSTIGHPTSHGLKEHTELKHIYLVCQSLHIENHNLCAHKFQVLYSIDHPPSFWEMLLCSCTCITTFQKSLVSLQSWLCLEGGGCKNLQNVNKPYINTVQSSTNKIQMNTESLHFIRLSWYWWCLRTSGLHTLTHDTLQPPF